MMGGRDAQGLSRSRAGRHRDWHCHGEARTKLWPRRRAQLGSLSEGLQCEPEPGSVAVTEGDPPD